MIVSIVAREKRGTETQTSLDHAGDPFFCERSIAETFDTNRRRQGFDERHDDRASCELFDQNTEVDEAPAASELRREGQRQKTRFVEIVPQFLVVAAVGFKVADTVEGDLLPQIITDRIPNQLLSFGECDIHKLPQ